MWCPLSASTCPRPSSPFTKLCSLSSALMNASCCRISNDGGRSSGGSKSSAPEWWPARHAAWCSAVSSASRSSVVAFSAISLAPRPSCEFGSISICRSSSAVGSLQMILLALSTIGARCACVSTTCSVPSSLCTPAVENSACKKSSSGAGTTEAEVPCAVSAVKRRYSVTRMIDLGMFSLAPLPTSSCSQLGVHAKATKVRWRGADMQKPRELLSSPRPVMASRGGARGWFCVSVSCSSMLAPATLTTSGSTRHGLRNSRPHVSAATMPSSTMRAM